MKKILISSLTFALGVAAFNLLEIKEVSVPATFKGNSVKIRAVVRYQACTDSVCYPPKSQEVTFTASVK